MAQKKTGDPIDDLPKISRKILQEAPYDGRYRVPYTVARLFVERGWGEHLGKSAPGRAGGMPSSYFQLNAAGLEAAKTARRRSQTGTDRLVYEAAYEVTEAEIPALLEDYRLEELIESAESLLSRVSAASQSTAGARGYLEALIDYRDKEAVSA